MASVGSIVGGAFRLFTERPGSVIAWMLLYSVSAIGMMLAVSLLTTGTLSLMPTSVVAQTPGQVPPGFFSAMLTMAIGWLVLGSILLNAVFRTVLRPEDSSFAGLRLGMDELRTIGAIVMIMVLGFVAMFIIQLLLVFLATAAGFVAGETGGAVVLLIATLFYIIGGGWVYVRLSVLFPLTLYRRRISIDAAWSLTRGRFWTLLGAYIVVGLVLVVLGIAITWATSGDYLVAMWSARGDQAAMQIAAAEFAERQANMPMTTRLVQMTLGTLVGGVGLALGPGVIASAIRELLIDRGEDEPDTQEWSEAEI